MCLHGLHRSPFGSRYTSGRCERQRSLRDSCECHELWGASAATSHRSRFWPEPRITRVWSEAAPCPSHITMQVLSMRDCALSKEESASSAGTNVWPTLSLHLSHFASRYIFWSLLIKRRERGGVKGLPEVNDDETLEADGRNRCKVKCAAAIFGSRNTLGCYTTAQGVEPSNCPRISRAARLGFGDLPDCRQFGALCLNMSPRECVSIARDVA